MDPITAIAASGLRARMESLDLLANNIANATTGGYKADREFYSLYVAPEAMEDNPPSTMPLIQRPWIDLSQGSIHSTGNPLDLALSGRGFFSVQGPNGTLYTRSGNFHLAPDGTLVNAEGYAVQSDTGAPIKLAPSQPLEILEDGAIMQGGVAAARIGAVDIPRDALAKQGDDYFRLTDAQVKPAPATVSVRQGCLEDSNTGPAEAAVRLVSVMRQFEMMQKAVSIGSEMNRQAIEQVARVGS